MHAQTIEDRIAAHRLIAVVVSDSAPAALRLADALAAGGVKAIELTLRTPIALECLHRIASERPEMLMGAGTVLTLEQVRQVKEAGAAFAVSPGLNPDVVKAAQSAGLPFFPGVMTPSEVESALSLGCRLLKFFPSELAGGVRMLKALAAPYAHTGVRFVPLGGINADNMMTYLDLPIVAAIGGSWLADRDLIKSGNFAEITRRAARAVATAGARRSGRGRGGAKP